MTQKKPQRGRGRPRVYKRLSTPTTFRLEAEMLRKLDRKAGQRGLTRQEALREAVATWLGERG